MPPADVGEGEWDLGDGEVEVSMVSVGRGDVEFGSDASSSPGAGCGEQRRERSCDMTSEGSDAPGR